MVVGPATAESSHLAHLYGVETRALVQAVKRNLERFPDDFMFRLSETELAYDRANWHVLARNRA